MWAISGTDFDMRAVIWDGPFSNTGARLKRDRRSLPYSIKPSLLVIFLFKPRAEPGRMLAALFAVVLASLGLVLLIHHGFHHMNDDEESLAKREGIHQCCFFQIRDISNHETWILICWTNALTLTIVANT
jgi:hypothetical protein